MSNDFVSFTVKHTNGFSYEFDVREVLKNEYKNVISSVCFWAVKSGQTTALKVLEEGSDHEHWILPDGLTSRHILLDKVTVTNIYRTKEDSNE